MLSLFSSFLSFLYDEIETFPDGLEVGKRLKIEIVYRAKPVFRLLVALFQLILMLVLPLNPIIASGLMLLWYIYTIYLTRRGHMPYLRMKGPFWLEAIEKTALHADAYHLGTNCAIIGQILHEVWSNSEITYDFLFWTIPIPGSELVFLIRLFWVAQLSYLVLILAQAYFFGKNPKQSYGASVGGYALMIHRLLKLDWKILIQAHPILVILGLVIIVGEMAFQHFYFCKTDKQIDHWGHFHGVVCGLIAYSYEIYSA